MHGQQNIKTLYDVRTTTKSPNDAFLRTYPRRFIYHRYVILRLSKYFRRYVLLTYSISRVLLEKLTGLQLIKKFPAFYGTRRFITSSQVPAICPYSEPARSSPHPPTWRSVLILSSLYARISHVVSFLQVSPTNSCIRLSSPQYALHSPPISFLILSHE